MQVQVIRQSRWRTGLLLVSLLAFLAATFQRLMSGSAWGIALIGLLAIVAWILLIALFRPAVIRLDPDGFAGHDIWGPVPRVRWSDIDRIAPLPAGGVAWTLKPGVPKPTGLRAAAARLGNFDGTLPSGFPISSKRLSALLETYRAAAPF